MSQKKPKPPVNTHIPWEKSKARTKWYLEHKRPLLDAVVNSYNPGHTEREYFYYSNPMIISGLFGRVLQDKSYNGIRIYFGSCMDLIPEGCDTCDKGKLVLIYVPTIKKNDAIMDNEFEEYYKLRPGSCSCVPLTKLVFNQLVENYKEKSGALYSSLSAHDRNSLDANEETRSLFIDEVRIKEIKDEIDYQMDMSAKHGASGVKVYINSYTDEPVQSGEYILSQRLTVQFVYTDEAGQDLNLERIDPRYNFAAIAHNTFNPTPPYP
nr:hypothetical protein [Cytophagales bacterium]